MSESVGLPVPPGSQTSLRNANQRRVQLLFRGEQVVAFEPSRPADVRSPS